MLRLPAMSLSNVRIVLVRPRGGANVGAVARAMKNMGLRVLILVGPELPARDACGGSSVDLTLDSAVRSPAERAVGAAPCAAKAMAVHADDVLEGMRCCESLAAAVADCGLVVGTTRRDGLYRAAAEPPRLVAPRMLDAAAANRVALVFGPEDHGLSNA